MPGDLPALIGLIAAASTVAVLIGTAARRIRRAWVGLAARIAGLEQALAVRRRARLRRALYVAGADAERSPGGVLHLDAGTEGVILGVVGGVASWSVQGGLLTVHVPLVELEEVE